MNKLVKAFFFKNGEVSKTAVFLTVATTILLALWTVQSLFAGLEVYGWTIPPFDSSDGVAVLTVLSGLYVASNSRLTDRTPRE